MFLQPFNIIGGILHAIVINDFIRILSMEKLTMEFVSINDTKTITKV
jgi:hypothetical protein